MPDDPETPKPNPPHGQNGQDSTSPLQSMFERMNKKPKPQQRNFIADEALQNESLQLTSEQEMFVYSTQQLAKMATEIKDIVWEEPSKFNDKKDEFSVYPIWPFTKFSGIDINYQNTGITTQDGTPVKVRFIWVPPSLHQDIRLKLETEGPFELVIDMHSDFESKVRFDEFAERAPELVKHVATTYYFDEEGHMSKMILFPIEFKDQREPLVPIRDDTRMYLVESKVDPSDFELVGTALRKILDKLHSQTPQTPEP